MGTPLPLDKAGIISTVLEGILYGFSVFMFGATMWVLLYHRGGQKANRAMVAVACALFVFSTMHIGVDIQRIIEGLVYNRNFPAGGPPVWFEDVSAFTFVFKSAIYSFQTVTGDGVVIWRCYKVWQSVWIIVFPIILLFGVATTAVGSVYACSQATLAQGGIFFQQTGQWIRSFYAMTLSTNLFCTALLAFRIWHINSKTAKHGIGSSLMPVVLVVIDAGLLYSATLFAALMCFVNESNGQYVVLDMVTPIISIAFYMVIMRVGLAQVSNRSRDTPSDRNHFISGHSSSQHARGGYNVPLQPLQVHVAHLTESRKDWDPSNRGSDHKTTIPDDVEAAQDF